MFPGQVHAIMGPNGSGKSSLVNALMGHPACVVTRGTVMFCGTDLLSLPPHERARAGLFLGFQYPKEIAGVTLREFLFAAARAQRQARAPQARRSSPLRFRKELQEHLAALRMDPSFAERFVNKGFSGGEKKKAEVLQLRVLRPRLALLDETDSGLDVDALRIVAEGVNALRSPTFTALLVTHYARILDHIAPDRVHVMVGGRIVESGGRAFARRLEREGYGQWSVGSGQWAVVSARF
jgi:Fe-S cluster assembly ATP-binding protein